MNGNIYEKKQLVESSFFQKLFKQQPEENAVIELNNLLASKSFDQISNNDIADIEKRYALSLKKEFKLNLEEFYAVYLNFCLTDKILSKQEIVALNNLKEILDLDDKTIEKLQHKIGEMVYNKTFQKAISNGRLAKEDEELLNQLESTLKLPKKLTEKIAYNSKNAYIDKYVSQIISDERLSPTEENELKAIAKSFNIKIILDDKTKVQLKKLRQYWELENLELPIISPDISIQKSELCHLIIENVSWFELRSIRQKVSYTGYSTSFKIAKGFYLRSGSYKPKSHYVDTMKLIDKGTVYLTNKRIIFMGKSKNTNIKIDKILNYTPYSDGLEISKETGKNPTLQLPKNADIFCMMLERLLNER